MGQGPKSDGRGCFALPKRGRLRHFRLLKPKFPHSILFWSRFVEADRDVVLCRGGILTALPSCKKSRRARIYFLPPMSEKREKTPKNALFLEENAKLFGETRRFSRNITTKSFHKGRRHADIRQHCFATCMMIALPAAEVFRGRRSREENSGGLRANGQYPIIKAMKSGELREDGKCIHWILLCMTWQIVAICVVLVVKCAILLPTFALFSDLCRW